MRRGIQALVLIASSTFAVVVLADAQCEGPYQDGNTWNLICGADAGDEGDDFQCDYVISVTNDQGESDTLEATGSVSPGDSGVNIWSAVQSGGGNIVSASIDSGSCSQ